MAEHGTEEVKKDVYVKKEGDKTSSPKPTGVMKSVSSNLQSVSDGRDFYEVVPVDMYDYNSRKQAMKELVTLQNELMTDYQNWAKENVKYTNMSDRAVMNRLRETNDDYTLQLLTNCAMSFQNGISFGSLFSTVMTFNMAKLSNPSFEQDISRMMLNMRDSMVPALNRNGGVAGRMFASAMDKYLTSRSVNMTHNQIVDAMNRNSLDDMVMTPRQLAALKVNFMEQYYTDIHSLSPEELADTSLTSKSARLAEQYDTALQHINAIANNSGFDMSVVAEEERYIVGLKMMDNPKYATMFEETSGLTGVIPMLDSDGTWNGEFVTRDGHPYNLSTSHPEQGSFTVRKHPVQAQDIKAEGSFKKAWQTKYANDIALAAQEMTDIRRFLQRNDEYLSKNLDKKKVNSIITDFEKSYKGRIIASLQDDVGLSEHDAKEFYKDTFTKAQSDWKDVCGSKDALGGLSGDDAVSPTTGRTSRVFKEEVYYAIDKEICNKIGVTFPEYTDEEIKALSRGDETAIARRQGKIHAFGERLVQKNIAVNGHGDTRSAGRILSDMQNEYLSTMSEDDLARLLIHAATNVEQGHSKRKGGTRPAPLSVNDIRYLGTITEADLHSRTATDEFDFSSESDEYGDYGDV